MNKILLSLIALALIAPVAGCKKDKKEPEKTEAAVEQPAEAPTETAAVVSSPDAVTETPPEAVAEGAAVEAAKDVAVKPKTEVEPKAEAKAEVKEEPAADAKPKTETKEPTSTAVFKDYKDLPGKWNGPEGTWLSITQTAPTDFNVVIKDLDKETEYAAIARDGTLVFSRDGKVETIRPGDGGATGMKWLTAKKQCIVIKSGEGYCKD